MKHRQWIKAGLVASSLALAAAGSARTSGETTAPAPTSTAHRVSFDKYSFLIDGKRTYLWSGEVHPYRLPSPELWPDIFQKMKAAGFNTASIYFSWGYHSPREGQYDFSGVRNLDKLLDDARDAGIYVIARPGPYINAEVDSGGFPLWLTDKPVKNRSPDPAYLKLADQWMTQIDRILARHQLTDGRGTVIAYQVENEYYNGSPAGREYMQHLENKARADGITVPLVGNHNATFVSGKGAVDVSGWDYYPQGFDCSHPSQWKPAPDMAAHRFAGEPLFTAEFQGGAFDPWGGPGYAKCAQLINDRFANVFYKENIAAGATAQNFYMLFGGTSWGWQAIPQNYTSYDYGAAITEGRQFDPKYYEDKRIGYFLHAVTPITKTNALAAGRVDNPRVIDRARINPDTGTQFHLVRHGDTTASTDEAAHLTLSLKEGSFTVPQQAGTAITLDGRESKLLLADYMLGTTRLVYSTSELMTDATVGNRDIAVLYGRHGSDGETLLGFAAKPKVTVLSGTVSQHWGKHGLRLDYRHDGLARVLIDGGQRPLLLLIGDDQATQRVWRQDTPKGSVLMIGSHLLRSAKYDDGTLALTGDGDSDAHAELFAGNASRLTWNGRPLATTRTASGSLAVTLPVPQPITLPKLDHWTRRAGAPEIARNFNDSKWRVANLTTTSSITKPGTLPVLFADDYGFHTGNTWYRGHFTVDAHHAAPSGLKLKVISGGKGGAFSAWLNGHFLGSVTRSEIGAFSFPATMLVPGDNVVSVLTVDMGHEEDYDSTGENRTARGIVSAEPIGADAKAVTWRLQGAITDENPQRGPYNFGGLYGERHEWPIKPGKPADWQPAALPANTAQPGVTWYRSNVSLALPKGQDTSLGLEITDPPGRHYRAMIFVNGWQMGNYIADLGPQHRFPIPDGIIDPHGNNNITIAVWKTDASPGGLGTVSLIDFGSYTSPVDVTAIR
ncbi:cellulase family glycosylhydrolase [Rhodanobacter glycinis]|uniref:beta-galactosidase n=2 Tax=Bacteria TaxID=2 RepID=A0A5B9DYL0_9GAMM|nr:beta-galactosidase [Rhodanobacter glycinis]QEE23651.1 cellulase family glycosylhydrolase [Rhodanobacter glycinis]